MPRSLALLTDLYQLTMAYGYWKHGLAQREACFHLHFRENPFGGGYAVCCGLAAAMEWLDGFRVEEEDAAYLAGLRAADGAPLFERAFLEDLRSMRFSCDVDAIPEGTAVFPHEPLVRVTGPLLQCQWIETPLLTVVNFQTLVATKAARVCHAARGDGVIEFGLRRAQGFDGGLAASRAAYVGGCAATSNVLAGRLFDIPVRGTHAHSWVLCFEDELEAFVAYADAMPHDCVLLVDTYDTIEGVKNAVEVGKRLRTRGHDLAGVRLDSGDLAALSREARRILDEAGFEKAVVVGSSDLDEHAIARLKAAGATIALWGVGTRLATAFGQPALGGVYKLSAIRDAAGAWSHRVKRSEGKATNPGVQQVRRLAGFAGDVVYHEPDGCDEPGEDLLVPVYRDGRPVYAPPPPAEARRRAKEQLAALPAGVLALRDPEEYPVRLSARLTKLKEELLRR